MRNIQNLTEADLEAAARSRLRTVDAYAEAVVRVPVRVEGGVAYAVEFAKVGVAWAFVRVIYPPDSGRYSLEEVVVLQGPAGPQGPAGGGVIAHVLAVERNGQTQFTVPIVPEFCDLFINGALYLRGSDYSFDETTPNKKLIWLGQFPLLTNFQITLKY